MDDAPLLGRPVEVDSDQIEAITENNQLCITRERADILKISKSSVENHLHQPGYMNHFDVWFPHKLSEKNFLDCISACDSLLKRNENVLGFCCCCLILFIYLFMAVLGLRFCARAFSSCGKQGPLFIAVHGPLTIAASLVVEHRLQTRRVSNCGSRAQLLRSMWDLPRPGLEPVSPALAGRFSITAPPGKPYNLYLF